ncbi:MAG: hypothetical protein ACSHXK_08725 [Oceanococcus sp.]
MGENKARESIEKVGQEHPKGWFFIGKENEFLKAPRGFEVAGESIVIFRTQSGEL